MLAMGDSSYLTHAGRLSHPHPQNWALMTPYSAVSSFNFPAQCDSSLIATTSTSSLATRPAPPMKREQLSPSTATPSFNFFGDDEDFSSTKFNPPMKLKNPSGELQISAADSAFPVSPFVCSSPYYGAFGVSAAPTSGQSTSNSPPSMNTSPNITSAGSMEAENGQNPHVQTSAQSTTGYISKNHAPILIAPNPATLRSANRPQNGPYRQDSLDSIKSTPNSGHHSGGVINQPAPFQSNSGVLGPSRARRKRKSRAKNANQGQVVYAGEISKEEELLLQLRKDGKLSWKEATAKFNDITGQQKQQACLQMRKKRLRDRLRVWTVNDERALTLAWEAYEKQKWETISKTMTDYGCAEEFPKEAVQKKWKELHPGGSPHVLQEQQMGRNIDTVSRERQLISWPHLQQVGNQILQESDNVGVMISQTGDIEDAMIGMEVERRRTSSDSSPHNMQLQHRQQQQGKQQHMRMFEQQNQNSWNGGP